MINFDALRAARTKTTPFTYIVGEGVVTSEEASDVRRDYPDIKKTGYLPLSKLTVAGRFADLITDLQSAELADILSDKLNLELRDKPRMITVRKISKLGDGRIHSDSVSKICTMLIYLNDNWNDNAGGAIRVLNGEHDMDDFAEEVSPLSGNAFAFARSDTSWHGHPPFAGERYVIQVTFLINQAALDRKEKNGSMQLFLKKLNPFEGKRKS
ncbi:MAG: 2OG-Fe(II) oxygenase [Robiginitomaculum sp.]|nr:2OG-Fe(II) oxygenase [Robiginitomaculum sp.]